MELLYLWIEDFRNIEKQGFDFSSEFKFEINISENVSENLPVSYKLNISYNEQYIDLFDGNITNVTGIIGKNGAGKSTLLHCLKMMAGKLSTLLSPLIFCVRDNKDGTIKTFYYNGGGDEDMKLLNVKIESEKSVLSKYKIAKAKPYTIGRFDIDGSKVKGLDFDFSEIACCYFSNTFDSHRENVYEGVYNVSTNYRVENFLKKYIESKEKAIQKSKKRDIPKIELWPSHIYQYHKSELKTLLKFLSYANTRKSGTLPDLPKALIIEFHFSDYEYLISEAPSSFLYDKNLLQNIQKLAVSEVAKSKSKRANFLNIVVLCSFYYSLRQQLFNPDNFDMDQVRLGISKLLDEPKLLFRNIRELLSPLSSVPNESTNTSTINDFLGEGFTKSVEKIEFSDTEMLADNKVHYRLKIDNNLWTVLSLIHDLKSLDDSTFIDYSWGTGLSTGEEAFLVHFARLNELKNKLGNKSIWLLIDEGDLYFHPQWQKEYFSHLINYVKFLFPRNKVQIVISTHSPFIASDLPKQNLIFLKKNEKGNCLVANNDLQIETFGSNIHELYADSFFLSGILIGDFAKGVLDKAFDSLSSSGPLKNQKFIESVINIVGEPIIKTKLAEMYAEKIGGNIELARLKAQQDYISQRVKEIENAPNQKNTSKKP